MRNLKLAKTIAAPLALAICLSACGDDDDDDVIVVPSPTPTATGTGTPTPTPPTSGLDVTSCLNQVIPGTGGTTVAQAVIPDTLTLNFGMPSGFPNGRRLPDPVIDVTLAVIFLDLDAAGQSPTTFFEVPLNPPANDVAFRSSFPYLAPPQGNPPIAGSSGAAFNFRNDTEAGYVRVDRMGMPAISTALISSDQKIPYNDADPSDDVDGDFVPELTEVLTGLTNALADDLTDLGLTPCAT